MVRHMLAGPDPTHCCVPPSHTREQQSALPVHAAPAVLQPEKFGIWVQVRPSQHVLCPVPVQSSPCMSQVIAPPPHLRTFPSLGSGTHGRSLQHWSLNWQTFPAAMQHPGSPV